MMMNATRSGSMSLPKGGGNNMKPGPKQQQQQQGFDWKAWSRGSGS